MIDFLLSPKVTRHHSNNTTSKTSINNDIKSQRIKDYGVCHLAFTAPSNKIDDEFLNGL